jgi:hypothetical protein
MAKTTKTKSKTKGASKAGGKAKGASNKAGGGKAKVRYSRHRNRGIGHLVSCHLFSFSFTFTLFLLSFLIVSPFLYRLVVLEKRRRKEAARTIMWIKN